MIIPKTIYFSILHVSIIVIKLWQDNMKLNKEYIYRHLKQFDIIKEIECFIASNIKPFGEKNFRTFLITRFNYGNNPKGIDEEYLKRRIEIFDKYTFPSINAQTDKNFTWIILLNSKTPEKFKNAIEEYKTQATMNLVLLWADCTQEVPKIGELISKAINISEKYVLTLRCDNDDMLAKNYIEEMKKNFRPIHNMYIDLIYGYNYDCVNNILNSYKCRSCHLSGMLKIFQNDLLKLFITTTIRLLN